MTNKSQTQTEADTGADIGPATEGVAMPGAASDADADPVSDDRRDSGSEMLPDTGSDTKAPPPQTAARRRPRRRRRPFVWLVCLALDIVVVLGVVIFLASVMLIGRDLPAPDWVAEKAGEVLSRGLGGGRAEVGAVTLTVDERKLPQVVFRDVHVTTPAGSDLVAIPELGVTLDKSALWQGKVQPRSLDVGGAAISLRRTPDGAFNLGFGNGVGPAALGSLGDAIAALRMAFELPALAPVDRIEVQALEVTFEDMRADRTWRIEDGRLLLDNTSGDLSISVTLTLPPDADGPPQEPATVALRLNLDKADGSAEISALVAGVAAADIAQQAPAVSWLEPLDADVSGAIILSVLPDGAMGALNGTLEIGKGVFQPETSARPVHFDSARTYFGYRPETRRLTFDELAVQAPDGALRATGHAYLEGLETGWPTGLIGQLQFSGFTLDPPGLLPEPAVFDGGALDVKITLNPFVARIGQLVLTTTDPEGRDTLGTTRLQAKGQVTADTEGWHVGLDMAFDQIESGPLLALWPLQLAPGTRRWIDSHLISGRIFDTRAGLRLNQGQRPDLSLTFEFRDAELRPMQTLPPITRANGFASVGRNVFSLSLDSGWTHPPEGGSVDMAGSVFRVGNTREKPATAELLLRTSSSVTAALSLLDQEPFRFLSKASQPVTMAEGRAALSGRIAFPMKRGLTGKDVAFDISGVMTDVTSTRAVPGRRLEAERLELHADNAALKISGPARLESIPLEGEFVLPFGEGADAPTAKGTIQIGAAFIKQFDIGLPSEMVRGAGTGQFLIALPRGAAPRFSLTSALQGVGLALPSLGWSKSNRSKGSLNVAGRLGSPPSVETLSISAPGLSAEGAVSLTAGGSLDLARFNRVSIGGWIDAPVVLRGRGPGRTPAVAVQGGRIDIRKTSMGGAKASGSGGGNGPPISLALDRLVVSEGLSLTGFRGELTQTSGMSGKFSGLVNGQASVTGTLVPGQKGGTAVRLKSDNAGAVFKAAGLFSQAAGGAMTLILQPRRERGEYDGQLKVDNVRVNSASGLTALINAISVVGLIDELNGAGLLFTDVEAVFRLTPSYVQVTRSSGVGPSLGISMEGVYDMVRDRMDMQGVFSPVYMVNSIGSIFTRKGEGLFGFNYRMRGSSSNPSVEVNPLSVLTPGMFREIFKAPPPRVRSGG